MFVICTSALHDFLSSLPLSWMILWSVGCVFLLCLSDRTTCFSLTAAKPHFTLSIFIYLDRSLAFSSFATLQGSDVNHTLGEFLCLWTVPRLCCSVFSPYNSSLSLSGCQKLTMFVCCVYIEICTEAYSLHCRESGAMTVTLVSVCSWGL